jgi:hypothetical protein
MARTFIIQETYLVPHLWSLFPTINIKQWIGVTCIVVVVLIH